MAYIEEDDADNDEPLIEELDEAAEEAARKRERKQKKAASGSSSAAAKAPPKRDAKAPPKRDGVPITEDLIRRKAEHNEGMLSTLEEIALHQLDIDKIEVLNSCRNLQILYLQNNLISKIEGVHRLKQLDYLNLALNNITRIENLEGCESLRKLDMTCNFVDLDELHTVGTLKNNTQLRELYLTGNPCAQHWESGCRDYVIATLPQLVGMDGKEIAKSERIKALQRLEALERELKPLAELARERKAEQKARRAERQRRREEASSDEEGGDVDEWCPDVRVEDARELRETKEKQEEERAKSRRKDYMFGDQPERERRLFKDDGTPTQMNTAKWPFSIDEDGLTVTVDVALPRFLDSNAVEAKVEPTYVRIVAKKHTLQLLLPAEVLADASTAQRSSTTGHLVLTCPKIHPIVTSKAPQRAKAAAPRAALAGGHGHALLPAPGDNLAGSVDIRGIVPSAPTGQAKPEAEEEPSLGPDFSDEEEVPPLA